MILHSLRLFMLSSMCLLNSSTLSERMLSLLISPFDIDIDVVRLRRQGDSSHRENTYDILLLVVFSINFLISITLDTPKEGHSM